MLQPLVILLTSRFPGELRARILRRMFGHEVHPNARIGLCFVSVEHLHMSERAGIASFTLVRGLRRLELNEDSQIGRFNWITAVPLSEIEFFQAVANRDPSLIVGRASAIMHQKVIDCNAKVEIGEYSILAGYRTTVVTHGIDVRKNVQTARPVTVGSYTIVSSNCVLVGGAIVPDCSVVGAGSMVRGELEKSGLYSGVPATFVAEIPKQSEFFNRSQMMVY